MNRLGDLRNRLFSSVDAASLAVFRIMFGAIMAFDAWRYLDNRWVYWNFAAPEFHFKYFGFEWVRIWPGDGIYWHFLIVGGLAGMVAIGLFYRLAIVLFTIGFAYIFLIDQALYLNHFYLALLFATLMCFLPAHRVWSVDAWLFSAHGGWQIPAWPVWLLRAQLEIVLIFAGLVKINPDWLRLRPLAAWLAEDAGLFLIGPLFTQQWAIAVAAYGVIVLHIVGAPLLFWRRTRLWVFLIYCLFHLTNHTVFEIGIFPWLTMAATLLFFDPDWPRQVWVRLRGARDWLTRRPGWHGVAGIFYPAPVSPTRPGRPGTRTMSLIVAAAAVWLAVQILVPLRNLLYPSDAAWSEEGHRFSWRMKLRDKHGEGVFVVRDPASGRTWRILPSDFLTPAQAHMALTRPDMSLQFAHRLEEIWRREHGVADAEVRADIKVSLNGREMAPIIDPARDLTLIRDSLAPADWILPLPDDIGYRQ
jgi:vitamin K-dependent gamma-carboxylase